MFPISFALFHENRLGRSLRIIKITYPYEILIEEKGNSYLLKFTLDCTGVSRAKTKKKISYKFVDLQNMSYKFHTSGYSD